MKVPANNASTIVYRKILLKHEKYTLIEQSLHLDYIVGIHQRFVPVNSEQNKDVSSMADVLFPEKAECQEYK